VDQEAQRAEAVTEVHGEVAGLLHRRCPGRARGHPGQVHLAGAMLDEYQHVQPLQQHCFYHQEVTGDDRVSQGGQDYRTHRVRWSAWGAIGTDATSPNNSA